MSDQSKKRGVLLVNLGTPDEPTTPALRKYLREFLSDPDVIDIPAWIRFILVQFIIVPFRSPKSAHAYRSIWTARGSPLRYLTRSLSEKVALHLRDRQVVVHWGMRYGNPSIREALEKLQNEKITEVTILPLYPQFAQSTVTSTEKRIQVVLKKLNWSPTIRMIPPFYRDSGFIRAQSETIRPLLSPEKHLVLSFHGIPERHILKSSPNCINCLPREACERLEHPLCYRGQCYETAHAIAKHLKLRPSQYSVSFQSRLGRTPWIRPFTDHHLHELLSLGKDQLVIACPSFVSDCLETLEEIGIRERNRFIAAGGKSLELAPCVNDSDPWSLSVAELIQTKGNTYA